MNRAAHIENVFFRGLGMFPNKQLRGGQGGRKEAVCARAALLAKMHRVYTGALLAMIIPNSGQLYQAGNRTEMVKSYCLMQDMP